MDEQLTDEIANYISEDKTFLATINFIKENVEYMESQSDESIKVEYEGYYSKLLQTHSPELCKMILSNSLNEIIKIYKKESEENSCLDTEINTLYNISLKEYIERGIIQVERQLSILNTIDPETITKYDENLLGYH